MTSSSPRQLSRTSKRLTADEISLLDGLLTNGLPCKTCPFQSDLEAAIFSICIIIIKGFYTFLCVGLTTVRAFWQLPRSIKIFLAIFVFSVILGCAPDRHLPPYSFNLPSIPLPSISLPKIGLPSFNLPNISMPSISWPSFNWSSINWPSLSWPSFIAPKFICRNIC